MGVGFQSNAKEEDDTDEEPDGDDELDQSDYFSFQLKAIHLLLLSLRTCGRRGKKSEQ